MLAHGRERPAFGDLFVDPRDLGVLGELPDGLMNCLSSYRVGGLAGQMPVLHRKFRIIPHLTEALLQGLEGRRGYAFGRQKNCASGFDGVQAFDRPTIRP